MLREQLIQLRDEYAKSIRFSSKLMRHFMLSQDYAAKIHAINKLVMDLDLVDVQYSARDLTLLARGKISELLCMYNENLPVRYSYEIGSHPALTISF
jgi:hypothetical protein